MVHAFHLTPGIGNQLGAGFALGKAIIHSIAIISGDDEGLFTRLRQGGSEIGRKHGGEHNKTHKRKGPDLEFSANSPLFIETWLKLAAKNEILLSKR
jgi:hypothetical protein